MIQSKNNFSQLKNFFLSYTFSISYIISILFIIIFGYFVRNYKQIEEYKQLTFWYENLDGEIQHTTIFSDFVKEARNKLTEDYDKYFKNPEDIIIPGNITEKIIVNNKTPSEGKPVKWKIGKTGYSVDAYYNNTKQFNNNENDIKNDKNNSENDKVFRNFTHIMLDEIKPDLDENQNNDNEGIQNLRTYSQVMIDYLTNNKGYANKIPNLRINNVYIFNEKTNLFIFYPFTDENLKKIDYERRPWFRATKNNYPNSFEKDSFNSNRSGLTGIYIDIIDKKPNAIRTLWYKFKDTNTDKEYILCFDLFLDKSSQISKEDKYDLLYLSEKFIQSGLNLKENDNIWIHLLTLSFFIASCLSLIYQFKIKNIILRISKHHANDLVTIKLRREEKHYASKDEGEIRLTIQGETKDINKGEQLREAGWKLNIQNIQVGVSNNQSYTKKKETTVGYEFTNNFNLNMSQNKPLYKCIETWRLVSEYQLGNAQTIGSFVVKWNTNNTANLEEVLDVKSIYWEKEYEEYLGTIREQLRNYLLISDEEEFVAVLDSNYSKQQNIPLFITKIDTLKKIINSSSYLKQGKIVFSEIKTLTELYKDNMVKAICSLHFLKEINKNQQLEDFLQVKVYERYLIEYQEGEFQAFYDSLDDETKVALTNQSSFKIMVYEDNINNIVSAQDDFCIISINNIPKLVAYSFTDNKFSNTSWIGWISWREVDIKYYNELYKCQLAKNHIIKDIQTYLNL